MIIVLYHIWLARNATRDGKLVEDARSLVDRVWRLLEEWASVLTLPVTTQGGKSTEAWLPPDQGWLKVNVDGATTKVDGSGVGGAVIRDHHGVFMGGACHIFPTMADLEHAKLLACRRGIQLAIETGARKVVLKTDNQGAMQVLTTEGLDRS